MVCPTKHQRQARHQRTQASGRKVFDTGITEDLLEVTLDPTYQLQSDNNSASDSDTFSGKGMGRMTFSLMDESDIELDPTGMHNSDSDGDSPSPGSGTEVISTRQPMTRRQMTTLNNLLVRQWQQHTHFGPISHTLYAISCHLLSCINGLF
jgi:hypothetical protein